MTKRDQRRVVQAWAPTVLMLAVVGAWGCQGGGKTATPAGEAGAPPAAPAAGSSANPLAGTEWRLVEFQSMDDAVGTMRPSDPSLYTMRLGADGTVNMRLNCNRANGSWKATPSADPSNGQFEFSPLAGTRASCQPPSMDERITAQAAYIRSYLLKEGRLYLSLMADGGIFAWEPITEVPVEAAPNAVLEAAILAVSPSYTKDVVGSGGGPAPGRYVYSRVDLNGDGRDEVMAYLMGSFFCGTGGCTLQLFTESQDGYALVSEFPLSRTPVIVAATKTNGWNDLLRLESGGGANVVRQARVRRDEVRRARTDARRHRTGRKALPHGRCDSRQGDPPHAGREGRARWRNVGAGAEQDRLLDRLRPDRRRPGIPVQVHRGRRRCGRARRDGFALSRQHGDPPVAGRREGDGDIRRHGPEGHHLLDGRWRDAIPIRRQGLLLRVRPLRGGCAAQDAALTRPMEAA